MEITGGSINQAKKYLEFSANDLDTAIMLYFESGEAPEQQTQHIEPTPPPQKLQQINEPAKKGLFGFGKKKIEQLEGSKQVDTKSVNQQSSQQPSTQQYTNINSINSLSAKDTKENKLFNGGGEKNSGSSTQFYQPPTGPYELHIDQFINGCVVKGKFFSFENQEYRSIFQELSQTEQVPRTLFEHLPLHDRPAVDQEIHASIDKHEVSFDPEKLQNNEILEKKLDWNPNETGRTLGNRPTSKVPQSHSDSPVNLVFQIDDTNGDCKVRIRTTQVFTVTLDSTTLVSDMLKGLQKNGGLPGLNNYLLAKVKLVSGQQVVLSQTIEQAGIKGRQVMVDW
eukprot:EST45285.1 hypothetical protein SS50377_14861 [Spironucleus salmonicida]